MWGLLFGQAQPKDPSEQARNWQLLLRKENRQLERQIYSIDLEVKKTKWALKEWAQKGEYDACRLLAKEIVEAQKAVRRINTAKAKLLSVECHIKQQMAIVRISGSMQRSAEMMRAMQELVKASDVSKMTHELSREMMKAGVIDEMVEEMFGEVEDDDLEEEVQAEVDKVLWDLTAGQLGRAPDAVQDPLPGLLSIGLADAMETEDQNAMQVRLQAFRS